MVLTINSWLNFSAIADYFRDAAAARKRNRNVKITIKELSRLTDAELKDIGLSRGDIYSVATESNDNIRGWV